MFLCKMNTFCEDQVLKASSAAEFSQNVLDWGTDGTGKAVESVTGLTTTWGNGHQGDDIFHKLFFYVHATGATGASVINVEWQTSDDEAFSSPTTLKTWSLAAGSFDLHYPIAGETLPRGLKRYQRLKVDGGTATPLATISAFVTDGCDDPASGSKE